MCGYFWRLGVFFGYAMVILCSRSIRPGILNPVARKSHVTHVALDCTSGSHCTFGPFSVLWSQDYLWYNSRCLWLVHIARQIPSQSCEVKITFDNGSHCTSGSLLSFVKQASCLKGMCGYVRRKLQPNKNKISLHLSPFP